MQQKKDNGPDKNLKSEKILKDDDKMEKMNAEKNNKDSEKVEKVDKPEKTNKDEKKEEEKKKEEKGGKGLAKSPTGNKAKVGHTLLKHSPPTKLSLHDTFCPRLASKKYKVFADLACWSPTDHRPGCEIPGFCSRAVLYF